MDEVNDYKKWYDEAILAANEVGYGPCSAADAIRMLADENKESDEIINELVSALEWMIDNDETNEGDDPLDHLNGQTWNEVNAYWIDGLNRARAAVAKAKART